MVKKKKYNVGFISFRFQSTDGVTLETAKWAEVLKEMGHKSFYFSGLSDRPEKCSMVVPEAYFRHPEIKRKHDLFFSRRVRTAADTNWIHKKREFFRKKLKAFIKEYDLDVLISQNIFSFPLNIPLTLALTEVIAETNIPTIAHNHDFTWERKNLMVNSVWDYITMAFPSTLPSIQHVVINSSGRHQLARRKGVVSEIIPNVMNFEKPHPKPDSYASDVRESLGIDEDEFLILQPTRVVKRKGIEHSIEMVSRLNMKSTLVISHASGDAGYEYESRLRSYAKHLGVRTIFASEIFQEERGTTEDGRKIYSLWDIYPHADLVTYPSIVEGFGNAFLEAIYFKRPIMVNNYTIYALDISPKGFDVIEFNDFITSKTIRQVQEVLSNPKLGKKMCEKNYQLALEHYSYKILRKKFRILFENIDYMSTI